MVQVSMNLTNYRQASIPKVLEFIGAEITGTGVEIAETELVGLLPMGALEDVVREYLKMPEFDSDRVIETHLLSE